MENAIVSALSAFPPQLVKTITCDRGTEFADWRKIEQRLGYEVYFADPYCAWQPPFFQIIFINIRCFQSPA